MIITDKEQLDLLSEYLKKEYTIDKEFGFIDGMQAMIQLVDKKLTEEKQK